MQYFIINLTNPLDGLSANQNQSYNCSFTSITNLKNSTLYIWNSSNNIIYNPSRNISGLTNSSSYDYNFTTDGNYTWNCLVFNNNSDSSFADYNYSISYDTTSPLINSTPSEGGSGGVVEVQVRM